MIGTIVQNYEIDELIDEGGMGSIYLGVHQFLKREVAIKDLNPLLRNKPEIIERFRNSKIWTNKGNHWKIENFIIEDYDWKREFDDSVLNIL